MTTSNLTSKQERGKERRNEKRMEKNTDTLSQQLMNKFVIYQPLFLEIQIYVFN